MGRHKDPETLKFIEDVKKKTELLGFKVIDEFKVLNGLFWVDLTLTPYEKGHETYITLEIDTKESDRIYKNLDKIFDLPSKDLEKPYYHFIVIYKGKLTKGNKKLMLEKARLKNIHLFENLKNDQAELEKFYRELEDLKISIAEYISRKGSTNPVETVKETILGLKEIAPVLIMENQKYALSQATMTSGYRTIKDISRVLPKGLPFDGKKYKQFAIFPIPREKYRIAIPDTKIALPTYMETKRSTTSLSFTFEVCDDPIVISCELIIGDGGAAQVTIDPNESDSIQLKEFEDVIKAITKKKTIEVYDQENKMVFRAEEIHANYKSSTDWYEDVSKLAEIQRITSIRIPAPKDLTLTGEDRNKIFMIEKVIKEGEFSADLTKVAFQANKDLLLKLVEIQRTHNGVSNMKLSLEEESQTLIGQRIPLGKVTYELPEMIFGDSIDDIEQRISKMEPNSLTEIILVPKSARLFKAIYPKWKKVQPN